LPPPVIVRRFGHAVVLVETVTADGQSRLGSGFIVSSDGTVVTCEHVIAGALGVSVRLIDGRTYRLGSIIGVDSLKDLVAFKIGGKGLPTVTMGNSADVPIGGRVYVIGSPVGLENTVTDGLLSGRRHVDDHQMLQISAPISPGSSGSPVFDSRGKVIGVARSTLQGAQNLNLAVPVSYVRALLNNAEGGRGSGASDPLDAHMRQEPRVLGKAGGRRGPETSRDLVGQYAAAVQWLRPHISSAGARKVSSRLVGCSRGRALDARLLLALEDRLNFILDIKDNPLDETEEALFDLGMAHDYNTLRRCLRRAGFNGRGSPTPAQLRGGLARFYWINARRRVGGTEGSFVEKVASEYYGLCGFLPPGS
jgi:hypothetical protein